MITVCHITTVHIAKDNRIYHKECRALAEAGFDVKLIVLNAKDSVSDYQGVEIINLRHDFKSKFSRILLAPRLARKAAEKTEAAIYHFHDPEFLFSALKLIGRGKKVIYDAHEDVPNQVRSKYWIPKLLRTAVSTIVKTIEMYAAKRLTAVVTVVDAIASRFEKVCGNVVQVRNFPDLEQLPIPNNWNSKRDLTCYVGDLTRIRGILENVESLADSNANMLLAGRFPSTEFENEVRSLPGWEKVKFYGFVNKDQVAEILGVSKIGLVTLHPTPSYIDALPVKLFEYMAAGIPVIASNFGWLKKIVEKHKCGLTVDPQNPKTIADAIDWLIDHDEEARKMGERGRKAVLESYNWSTEERKLLDLYQTLLA